MPELNPIEQHDHASADMPLDHRELVTFRIGEQDFSMDIMLVREIRGWSEATVLPYAPRYVLGVINLRGAVVPIIDLAARLGLPPTEPGPRHVIIIVVDGTRLTGFLVSVSIGYPQRRRGRGAIRADPERHERLVPIRRHYVEIAFVAHLDVAAALPGQDLDDGTLVPAEAECLN